MAIDRETRFSWRLLGRARDQFELLLVYAALLAHGTELDATSVALMIPGVSAEAIADAMRLLEEKAPCERPTSWCCSFCTAMRW